VYAPRGKRDEQHKKPYQQKIIVIVIHGALIAFWFLERKKLA
jgi:hypothetical protein